MVMPCLYEDDAIIEIKISRGRSKSRGRTKSPGNLVKVVC